MTNTQQQPDDSELSFQLPQHILSTHGNGEEEYAYSLGMPGSTNYSVNGYYPEFQTRDAEGGLTIVIQSSNPGNLPAGSYWLQAPNKSDDSGDNTFLLILRVYVPLPEISFTQTWEPPKIMKLDSDA